MQQQQHEHERGHGHDDDTVHAAAIVLAAAARSTSSGLLRHQQQLDDHDHASSTATKKTRWWSRLKAKLMRFRPHGHPQRIVDAPAEPSAACAEHAAADSSSSYYYTRHAPQPALAFVAPPSSPASSVLTSESPSPVVLLSANIISSSFSSPTASIFAIGPYAREPQQLVSPPAFSAGLTEPSTAPLTPPPESGIQLLATTPSSPEVPFARFLSPRVAAGGGAATEGYFLHAYQLQPGSPILVSPGSTSSSPPFWTMQHRVRAHNEGSLLDGGHIPVPITEDGSEWGSRAMRRKDDAHDDEVVTVGGEFVFGNSADAAAGGEVAGAVAGSLALGDATEQWPFLLAHHRSS